MDQLERLKRTREILTPEDAWTKRAYVTSRPVLDFREANVPSVPIDSPAAKCFCVHGAFAKAAGLTDLASYQHFELDRLLVGCVPQRFTTGGVLGMDNYAYSSVFNDDPVTTHADVLNALDCAIAKLEAK